MFGQKMAAAQSMHRGKNELVCGPAAPFGVRHDHVSSLLPPSHPFLTSIHESKSHSTWLRSFIVAGSRVLFL